MTARSLVSFLVVAATTASSALAASWTEWETTEERLWSPDTLEWAWSIDAQGRGINQLAQQAPPPREMWCEYQGFDTANDVVIFQALMEDWLYDFLDVDPLAELPELEAPFPAECVNPVVNQSALWPW